MTYICHLFEASIHIWRLRLYCLVKNKAIFIYKWYKKYICDIKAKCVQTCLHQSMLSSPLLQVEPQRNCWKILSYFFYWWWGDIFLTSFIFELECYFWNTHSRCTMFTWATCSDDRLSTVLFFFVNTVICFSKSITVTDLIHMLLLSTWIVI